MHSKWLGRAGLAAIIVGVVAGTGVVSGCVAERDPINRVQPSVVPKSFFLGEDLGDYRDDPEFRTKSFNIDSAANTESHQGAIGGATAVERVRWEVLEDMLVARRSYQESPGADDRGLPRKEVSPGKWEFPGKADGTIIAAYRIESHFDIRRDYNSQSGEELNTIVENSVDRPWYQREYMRVDWSENLAESTSGDTSWVFGEGAKAKAVAYSVTNANDADAPRFESDGGYFDVTNKYQLSPEAMPGWGVPECLILGFFNGTTSFDCTPTEVKVRHSFVRLTGEEDFEPFEESRAPRDIVGNWGSAGNSFNREYGGPPITAWDPQYGYTDAKTKTFYAFHNIWEKSHQAATCASNDDAERDGTADECDNGVTGYAGSTGSQCDVHIGKCTIPVRDRKVKTIGYWLNEDAPADLTDEVAEDGKTVTSPGALEEITHTWNQLMKVAVATRREVECRRTHTDTREACHDLYFDGTGPAAKDMVQFGGWGIDRTRELDVDEGNPVVTTCHNPVRAYDLPMCGEPGEKIRLGDLRKNYAIYWPHASRAPYGGVASIGGDPLTGEMLGVTATTMMRSATAAAAQQRDIIQLALGDVGMEDLMAGAQATRYADLVKDGKLQGTLAKAKTSAEIASAVQNIDLANVRAQTGIDEAALAATPRAQRQLAAIKAQVNAAPYTATSIKADNELDALLEQLGPSTKAEIGNRGLNQLLAMSKDKEGSTVYNAIQTFASRDTSRAQDLLDRFNGYLGDHAVCFHDSATAAGAGSIYQPQLAPYFRALYGGLDAKERGVKIYRDLLREAVKGIAFHEVGHSLGMRHNFSSSWDSPNYSPQYWQLRTNEGKSVTPCKDPREGGPDTCLGPRYLDPMTEDEQGTAQEARPGIEYFANTSTMEYQIERFGETVGAGTYDLHFMKTVYGRSLETFDEAEVPFDQQQYFAVKTLSQGIPSDLVFDAKKGYGMHYTRAAMAAKVFDPSRDCRAATEEEKATAKWRVVHGKICAPSPKNHLAYEDMESKGIEFQSGKTTTSIGVNGVRWTGKDENGKSLIRWHYRYGEDYSRGGYIHAKMMDSGADIYEITANVGKRFDLVYPWQYFRRQNKEFAWWAIPGAVDNMVFSRLRAYHWTTTTEIARSKAEELNDDDQARPHAMAAVEMFNLLQRAILMPEPGTYGDTSLRTPSRDGALEIFDLASGSGGIAGASNVANVGIIDGRFVQIDFDNDRGGSWDYAQYPVHVGFDEEKVLALRQLVDSRPTLSTVSRENALDGRDPYISFRTDTPHAIDRLLGGMLSEDWETVAPQAVGPKDKSVVSVFNLLDRDGTKLKRPAGSSILFPNVGYQNELSTGIYAMLFSRLSSDMALFNKMRVRIEGDSGPAIPAERRVAFTDPSTGFRYLATRYGTETIQGRAVERGIASRMLQRANELAADAYVVKVDAKGYPVLDADGEMQPVLTDGLPTVKDAAAEQRLRRYVGLLDGMRQVSRIFGGGPLGGGGSGD